MPYRLSQLVLARSIGRRWSPLSITSHSAAAGRVATADTGTGTGRLGPASGPQLAPGPGPESEPEPGPGPGPEPGPGPGPGPGPEPGQKLCSGPEPEREAAVPAPRCAGAGRVPRLARRPRAAFLAGGRAGCRRNWQRYSRWRERSM